MALTEDAYRKMVEHGRRLGLSNKGLTRSEEFKRRVSASLKGRYDRSFVDKVNAVIDSSPNRPTLKQICDTLQGELGGNYDQLRRRIYRARKLGVIDGSRIRPGPGSHPYRGGSAPRKFRVGDKARLIPGNSETPKYLVNQLRLDTPRTIVAAVSTGGHVWYYVGTNKQGCSLDGHKFIAPELAPYVKNASPGRPRTKRAYNRRGSLPIPVARNDALEQPCTVSPSISCVNCDELRLAK